MLDQLKTLAARRVGQLLASDATMKVVGDPRMQAAMMRAINLRADAREVVERQVQGVAAVLDLVTRDDVASLKRTIRDLEDMVEELRDEVGEAQKQAKSAKVDASEARTSAADAVVKAEAAAAPQAPKRKPATKSPTTAKKRAPAKKPAAETTAAD